MTESCLVLPPNPRGEPMCDNCEAIDQKVEHYERVARGVTDQLTIERMKALIKEMHEQKAALHPE
jgi:hypothetical protein